MAQDFFKRVNESLETAIKTAKDRRMDDDRRRLLTTVGQDVAQMLAPVIREMAESAKANKEEVRNAMYEALGQISARDLNIDTAPIIEAIQTAMSNVKMPEPKVTITSPDIKIPDLKMPDEMNIRGWLEFMDVFKNSDKHPISVQLRDHKGNPINMFESTSSIGGGGGFRRVIIDDIRASASSVIDQALGAVKVTGDLSATLALDYGSGEIGSNTPRFVMATDAVASVYVTGANGSLAAAIVDSGGVAYSGSNPLPITIISGSSAGTEYANGASKETPSGSLAMGNTGEESGNIWGVALASGVTGSSVLRIVHAVDVGVSVNVINTDIDVSPTTNFAADAVTTDVFRSGLGLWNGSAFDRARNTSGEGNALRVQMATDSVASVAASQVGTWTVTGITNSIAANIVDSGGVAYSGSNPVPIGGTVLVSDVTASLKAALVDSSGIQYSGSNPLPITIVSEALASTIAVGDISSDGADTGSAPIKVGGIARTANPTAVAAGDRVSATYDDVGRQLMRPVQVRDLTRTARVALANGTETTLLAASAASYHDLIYLMAANNSDAAVSLDIRAVTAGNIMMTVQVPANGTAGIAAPVPLPQDETGNNWTIDMPDITGTTITVTALFSREV